MLKVQNKSTKRIRIVLIVFFAILIWLTSQSFLVFPVYQTAQEIKTTADGGTISKDVYENVIEKNAKGEIQVVKDKKGKIVDPNEYLYSKIDYSVLDMIYMIFEHNASVDMFSKLGISVMLFSLFLILPIIAIGFQLFDFYYNLKNVVGIIVSFAGVYCVLNFVGLPYLGGGSVLSLIIYVFTMFMSVMGMMARYTKTKEDRQKEAFEQESKAEVKEEKAEAEN